jgi:2,4-diaminopentanoate dehydrogenase
VVYKVIQWGTGGVGRYALGEILKNPEFKLVGVKAFGKEKVGMDAGDLCGMPKTGVIATDDISQLPLQDADVVLYMPKLPNYDEITQLLRAGVNVITTANHVYPQYYGEEVYQKLQDACLEGRSTFHGAGINPAFMSEILPLTISRCSHRASRITVREVSDINEYISAAPEIMMDGIGFGKSPREALDNTGSWIKFMSDYFSESIQMICDHLGVTLQEVRSNHSVAVANARVELRGGLAIEPGTVACRKFEWQGIVDGEARVFLSTSWKTTLDCEPKWELESDQPVEWTITVEGTPSFQCRIACCDSYDPGNPRYRKGGEGAAILATAVHPLNAIPFVCAAEPGVKTPLDIGMVASRGAFRGL